MGSVKSSSNILVTGADGFIGSHLTESLVRQGFSVRAFVYYNSFNSWGWLDRCNEDVKGHFEVIAGDIRDPYGVKTAMKNCNAVLHLAALVAIPYSYNSPETYVDTNIKGTLNVLQAARELKLDKIIHTSTSEVYGSARFIPITEDHPILGQSPYSASKISADHLVNSFYSSFELPVVTLRPFNTYGPRQSLRAVIPTIITQIAAQKKSITLGSTFPTRDFSFVKDTVAGFIAALTSINGLGQVVNLGSNFEISIQSTVELIAELMNRKITVNCDESRVRPSGSEVDRLFADNSKAKDLFNWTPEYAGIDGFKRGLSETIEWFLSKENLRHYKPDFYNI